MGEKQKALEFYNQALPIYRQTGDKSGEAGTLGNLGNVYDDLGDKQKALDYSEQALSIFRQVGDRGDEAAMLDDIGIVYDDLGDKQKALNYYAQALPIYRQVGSRDGEAGVLNNMGIIYDDLGEPQKALESYNQALPLATAVNNPLVEAAIFDRMLRNLKVPQPTLAIFYGKQAVNLAQQVRANIQGLDRKLQASFLASKEDYYHDLADLLITQGRLPEAQQVLDLLKQQEYQDYVRPVRSLAMLDRR